MKRAVLFSGGINAQQAHQKYQNDLIAFYQLLLEKGYPKEQIRVHLKGGALLDLDGDGVPEVCFPATRDRLLQNIAWLGQLKEPDQLVIMVTNHGAEMGIEPWGERAPRITPGDIERVLLSCLATKILVFGQCYAGLFGNMRLSNSVICCACGDIEKSYPIDSGEYDKFIYYFIGALRGQHPDSTPLQTNFPLVEPVSIESAHFYASKNNGTDSTPVIFDAQQIAAKLFL